MVCSLFLLIIPNVGAFPIPNVGAYISTGNFPNDIYLETIPYNEATYHIIVDKGNKYNLVIPFAPSGNLSAIQVYSPDSTFDIDYSATLNKPDDIQHIHGRGVNDSSSYVFTTQRDVVYNNIVISISGIESADTIFGKWDYTNDYTVSDINVFPLNTAVNISVQGYVSGDMVDGVLTQLRFYRNNSGLYLVADTEDGSIDLIDSSEWIAPVGSITIDQINTQQQYYGAFETFMFSNLTHQDSEVCTIYFKLPTASYPANSPFANWNTRIADLKDALAVANSGGTILDWLFDAIDAFFDIKLFGNDVNPITIGTLFSVGVAVPLLMLILKVFFGG